MTFARLVLSCLVASLVTVSFSSAEKGEPPTVKVGAKVLLEEHRDLVAGKRVGLITNPSAMVGGIHLIDLFHADPEIHVVALFGPEHGLRGTADAGEPVADAKDERTGATIYSLYGAVNRPTPVMLDGIDVLIFDMQDVGTRFYTYPATMGRAMISAAEARIPFIVLDRPNPIGGIRIEGAIREERWRSGIGPFPTPVTHGMTVGELARMIKGEKWHPGLEELELHVIPMQGWRRSMLWPETGLPWIRPSPNLPDFVTAIVYPGTCFFEGTAASEGRGTHKPFLQLGAPGLDREALAADLNGRNLPGVSFSPLTFTPISLPGMAKEPKLMDEILPGIAIQVNDPESVEPVALGIHLLDAFYRNLPRESQKTFFDPRGMAIRAGNAETQTLLERGEAPAVIIAAWEEDVARFRSQREPYLLYR